MTTTKNGDLFSIWNFDGHIAYEDITKETEDFDMKYCIGTGAYGYVYKVKLPRGKIVAVKKLHGLEAQNPAFDKSFRNEVKVLSEVKHRHVVKLYGFCLHNRNMFLIYQYMEKGSLFSILACLYYVVTEKCDVYSFGVVALETLVGSHPQEILASLQSKSACNITLCEVLDQRLAPPTTAIFQDIIDVAIVAFACLNSNPRYRPSMKCASQGFLTRRSSLNLPLHHKISLQQLMNQEFKYT
ncbi:unnamed protein product [Lupinus luteus]|uniref:non-specific serine/threonine protein kinase n=1 Tax=Lupinus luteus TaxID=3873 RepID=A0AAV1WBW0_LUPLU